MADKFELNLIYQGKGKGGKVKGTLPLFSLKGSVPFTYDIENRFGRRDGDGLIQIWPSYPRSILWPPKTVFGDKQANTLANIFKWSDAFDHSLDPGADWSFTF